MALDRGALKTEIGTRYDASLALTQDATVISADSNRFNWATQAKVQCGIAIGFLKSGFKDPVSVGKCADAYNRLQGAPAQTSAVPVVAAPVAPEDCSHDSPDIVFFDWNSAVVPESAMPTLNAVADKQRRCGWVALAVTGHADRSGPDGYNMGLSLRRAAAVASVLESKGVNSSILQVTGHGEAEPKVPTPDGEQNPTNRRVEISVK
jgi:outer membrane protein OmpA-like peptidoglycan-associated protein